MWNNAATTSWGEDTLFHDLTELFHVEQFCDRGFLLLSKIVPRGTIFEIQ